jgi:hypothetical protein
MKTIFLFFAATLALFVGCTSAPSPATTTQQMIAQGVDDALAIGLVPVFVKNASYIPAASAIADALGAISGDQFTPDDTAGVIDAAKRKGYAFAPEDERMIAATINAAWSRFAKNYQQQIGAGVRPDVKLFAGAVADGIRSAALQAANTK